MQKRRSIIIRVKDEETQCSPYNDLIGNKQKKDVIYMPEVSFLEREDLSGWE